MADKVLMKGNEAIAEAALMAGCRHYFGYPITPQTELTAYMAKKLPRMEGGVFLQAESEVAAINMVYGVAATGKRVMTSSSSPGISLKGEGLSYMAGSDLPALVVNVQRGGPGLGGIQPSQADYFQATRGTHGDYRSIVLAPASVQEMASLTVKGFDLADKYRMTTMLLADGTLGQMMEPVSLELGDIAAYDKPWALTGTGLQREQNVVNSLYLDPAELEKQNFARYDRYKLVEENEVMYEEYRMEDAEVCLVSFGIAARVSKNAVDEARGQGLKVGLLRPITLWPFPKEALLKAADRVRSFISVELSMGQLIEDVQLATECKRPVLLCNRSGGMIPTLQNVLDAIDNAIKQGGEPA